MDEPEQQGEVGAGHRLQVQALAVVGQPGGRGAPRVDHDEAARGLRTGQVTDERRHRLGDVRAEQQDRVGPVEVVERKRQAAVDPEGPIARRSRRRHAVPAVVVDAARAEREPRELAEQVRLLVREAAAAEDAHGVGTMR